MNIEIDLNRRIGITDIVSVSCRNETIASKAMVLHAPNPNGDNSWTFHDLDTGEIYYISEGITVTLFEDKET